MNVKVMLDGIQHVNFIYTTFCANWVHNVGSASQPMSTRASRPISAPWTTYYMGYHTIAKDLALAKELIVTWLTRTIESKTHTSASPRTCYATLKSCHSWLSTPRVHCLRTDQSVQDPWSLIADYLNWIFGCRRSTSAAVLLLDVRELAIVIWEFWVSNCLVLSRLK